MSRLNDELSSRGSKLRREIRKPPEFPEWWPLAQVILGGVVAAGFVVALVFSGGGNTATTDVPVGPPPAPVGSPGQPPAGGGEGNSGGPVDDESPGDPEPVASNALVVGADGAPAEVPEAALNRARSVLRAIGSEDAQFVQFIVVVQEDNSVTFDVRWVPRGEDEQVSTVTVRRDAAGVWLPG